MGDDAPIDWVHRDTRFGEKLATPRHVDRRPHRRGRPDQGGRGPLPHDELTLHYGLSPGRTVASSPSTSCPTCPSASRWVCSRARGARRASARLQDPPAARRHARGLANPEDYTNRGRIITPLKDRFGSQIRTHYPLEVATEVEIIRQEARSASVGGVTVAMPGYMEEVVATFSQLARSSSHVNQRSGVSVACRSATTRCSPPTRCAVVCGPVRPPSFRVSVTWTRSPRRRAARWRSSRSRRAGRRRSSRTSCGAPCSPCTGQGRPRDRA